MLWHVLARLTRPSACEIVEAALLDLVRSRPDLIAENALLRQQLIILRRSVKKPRVTRGDRLILIVLARLNKLWRNTILIVQPDTLLRWHRDLFRLVWRYKSKLHPIPRIPPGSIALLKQMAVDNLTWGAERIRGELLKLNIHLSKRTIQRYIRLVRAKRPPSQNWKTFLNNHKDTIWACDFLQVYDLLFRPVFLFFILELGSRRCIHVGITRAPTNAWVAQQLREATPWGQRPRYLIRDNDGKFGDIFRVTLSNLGIEDLRLPCYSPDLNAFCERFQGSVRRECLDYVLILDEKHLARIIKEYVAYYNRMRPHQGIGQRIPDRLLEEMRVSGPVVATPVLGGLHHHYYRKAA